MAPPSQPVQVMQHHPPPSQQQQQPQALSGAYTPPPSVGSRPSSTSSHAEANGQAVARQRQLDAQQQVARQSSGPAEPLLHLEPTVQAMAPPSQPVQVMQHHPPPAQQQQQPQALSGAYTPPPSVGSRPSSTSSHAEANGQAVAQQRQLDAQQQVAKQSSGPAEPLLHLEPTVQAMAPPSQP